MANTKQQLIKWLKDFQKCVHVVDYETARKMYYPKGCYFGSVAHRTTSLNVLIKKQWSVVWPNITKFAFDYKQLDIQLDSSNKFACLMLPWKSTGYTKGKSFKRNGRVTILLRKAGRSNWRAYHTHYSLKPGTRTTTKKK